MHILRIEIKSINDDKLNLINKSFKNMLSLDREINFERYSERFMFKYYLEVIKWLKK